MGFTIARIYLLIYGIAIFITSLSLIIFGPEDTLGFFGMFFPALVRSGAEIAPLLLADYSSELRFLSVIWLSFGLFAIATATKPDLIPRQVYLVLLIQWLGGLGRVFAYLQDGVPQTIFQYLMWFELAAPLIIGAIFAYALDRHRRYRI